MRKVFFISGCLLFLFQFNLMAKVIPMEVWTYYKFTPFMVNGSKTGLSYDLVEILNDGGKGKFEFKLRYIPRKRIDTYLKKNAPGIVLFVNWVWMGENAKGKYLWTSEIMKDSNEIISRNAIEYNGPESLFEMKFGGVRGRKYKGLEPFFKSGAINRFDVNLEVQNLFKLVKGRIDVTSQPRSMALALISENSLQGKVQFASKPLFKYTRHVLVTPSAKKVFPVVEEVIRNLPNNLKWQERLKLYGLK